MANREKGTADADKYSELIQVLVKPATKKELQTRAIIEGKTLSCLLRDVLLALGPALGITSVFPRV